MGSCRKFFLYDTQGIIHVSSHYKWNGVNRMKKYYQLIFSSLEKKRTGSHLAQVSRLRAHFKISIMMGYTMHFLWHFEMSHRNGSIELQWAENEQVIFYPSFDPISFIVQSNYQFWFATLRTLYKIFKWAPKSAQLS